jgi:hypothetical protein
MDNLIDYIEDPVIWAILVSVVVIAFILKVLRGKTEQPHPNNDTHDCNEIDESRIAKISVNEEEALKELENSLRASKRRGITYRPLYLKKWRNVGLVRIIEYVNSMECTDEEKRKIKMIMCYLTTSIMVHIGSIQKKSEKIWRGAESLWSKNKLFNAIVEEYDPPAELKILYSRYGQHCTNITIKKYGEDIINKCVKIANSMLN